MAYLGALALIVKVVVVTQELLREHLGCSANTGPVLGRNKVSKEGDRKEVWMWAWV